MNSANHFAPNGKRSRPATAPRSRRPGSSVKMVVNLAVCLSYTVAILSLSLLQRTNSFALAPKIARRMLLSRQNSLPLSDVPGDFPSFSFESSYSLPSLPFNEQETRRRDAVPASVRDGLSRIHQSLLSRTSDRGRFVSGRDPLILSFVDNPTRKWLNLGRPGIDLADTDVLVNGTLPVDSLASMARYHWLDDTERNNLIENFCMVSWELAAEIHTERPGYLNILPRKGAGITASATRDYQVESPIPWSRWKPDFFNLDGHDRDRLWVTGFSLAGRQGIMKSVDCDTGTITSVNKRSGSSMLWPNEVKSVPTQVVAPPPSLAPVTKANKVGADTDAQYRDALLVCDGFLVPGKDKGGIYVVKNPGDEAEWTACLTDSDAAASYDNRWFYHKATWVDLTGDGRQSILSARCQVSTNVLGPPSDVTSGITKKGELVWLECPSPHSYDPVTGTPLDKDGTTFDPFDSAHLPWKTHVLATGPDVMFCVADLDPEDNTVEVLASQFFGERVSLHSIEKGPEPKIVLERTIDDRCGAAFASILADLKPGNELANEAFANVGPRVVDCGSTVETLKPGDSFSHLLVTSHECSFVDEDANTADSIVAHGDSGGGSLFAYRIPEGKDAWKTSPWIRSTVASGFKVRSQLQNMINPGAPGFVYTFHAHRDDATTGKRPLIAVAGDCAESAYVFRPDHAEVEETVADKSSRYKLMAEIQCGATVGSIGIGYDDFLGENENDYAKLYIPCFEKDKILVFALGSGEEECDYDCW